MCNDFKELLENAKARIDDKFVSFGECGNFSYIYPFTTENISGYIDKFDLKNKSLLTLGSSGDQVINAALKGSKEQTVLDICPFTKYYFYLKKAALLTLNYEEFIKFFCYEGYPNTFENNYNAFSIEIYDKIKLVLKELDKESFIFWDVLFKKFYAFKIRQGLFSKDEDSFKFLKNMNLYLSDENMFNKSKLTIIDINPKFLTGDIFKLKLDKKYDNIFLSNLCTYHSINELKKLINNLNTNLSENGSMLIGYLYDTKRDSKYKKSWAEIYNLDKVFKILGNYITDFESFTGVMGLRFSDENIKDSAIIYQKRK